METIQLLDRGAETNSLLPEVSVEPSPNAVKALGHVALGDQLPRDYMDSGIEQLEAYANSQASEAHAQDDTETQADTRIHDVEAAHEAALLENSIFDAHVAALKENEIFDAHVAAMEEDKERAKVRAQQSEQASQKEQSVAADKTKTNQERAHSPSAPASQEELRQEAAAALEEAGVAGLPIQVPMGSEIHKDVDGNLTIVNGNSAIVIEPVLGGKPQVTEYTYNKNNGTPTLTVTTGVGTDRGHIAEYTPTQTGQWQTHDKVITLPPALTRRFGVERAVVAKQR